MKYCSVPGGNQYFSQVKVIGTNERNCEVRDDGV